MSVRIGAGSSHGAGGRVVAGALRHGRRPAPRPRPRHRARRRRARRRATRSPTSPACASATPRSSTATRVRTGVTAVLPHGGNLFREKVPGAVFVGNAFGKLAGSTQVEELGTIETPIVLTNTLAVGAALDAVVRWTLAQPGNENVRSVNGAGRRDQRRRRSTTSAAATSRAITSRAAIAGASERRGRRRRRRRRHRHDRVRLEGRHRHVVAPRDAGGRRSGRSACWCRPTTAAG